MAVFFVCLFVLSRGTFLGTRYIRHNGPQIVVFLGKPFCGVRTVTV